MMATLVDLGWDAVPLGECATWMSGGTPSTSQPMYWGGDIPWITSSSLRGFFIRDSERRVTELGLANGTRLVPPNTTIFVVRGMSLQKEWRVGITTRAMAFGQDCKALIPDDRFDPLFFAFATRAVSDQVLQLVERAGHGTGRLATGALQDVEIPLPPVSEQRAIAHALQTAYRASEASEQVIAGTKELKKSLMRHLFTYGVDVESQTKEVDFGEVRSEWRMVPLGELSTVVRGSSPRPKGNPEYFATTHGIPMDHDFGSAQVSARQGPHSH